MTERKISLRAEREATPPQNSPLLAYSIALFSVALALGITRSLGSLMSATPAQLFFVAVMVSAWYGGIRAGLLATVLSTLAINYFFIAPYKALTLTNLATVVQLSVFTMSALLISGLNQSRHNALRRERRLRIASEAERSEAKDTNQRLEIVLSSINDGFYVLDRNWRFTYINDRLCEMARRDRNQILDHNLWDLFPDIVDTDLYFQFHRALDEQISVHVEYFYATWNRWYDHRIYPSSDGLTVLVADITDYKQVEESLLESENRLQMALVGSRQGVWEWDLKRQILTWDERCKAIFGLPSDFAVTYEWHLEALHPDDRQRVYEAGVIALRERIEFNEEYRTFHPDNTMRWILARGRGFYDMSGDPYRMSGTVMDITDRKQIEAALRESETRFRQMTNSAPMLVWMSGIDKLCNYFNQPWLDFTGRTMEQELGNGWTEGVHADDFQRCLDIYSHAFDARHPFEMDYRLKRFDGEYRWILDAGVPRFTSDGEFVGYIGSCIDIDDRKQAEAERAGLLEREQSARHAAETANRIKDEFLAVLSHELRTPLNPILGWAKLLKKGVLNSAKTQEALDTIERNAQLQAQLIEDLLDISRILQGKLALTISWVDLKYVVSTAQETVCLAADAKRIELKTTIEPDIGRVSGDITRLQQVVWNLLSNAVKFTPQGGRVEVRLAQVQDQVQLQVQDTGKGISAEFLPHVFDHFRQEDGATTRQFGGLGLGLSIVRQIVELHGGTVEAESPGEGQGATFTVTLPLVVTPIATSSPFAPTLRPNLSGVEILVVDDEVDSRDLVAYVLEETGATIISVGSAIEALKILSRQKLDLLVSDVSMPEMDGYTLIRQLRSLPSEQNRQIPAIALTAHASETDQQQILQAGFQRHVTKPLDPTQLAAIVGSLVKR